MYSTLEASVIDDFPGKHQPSVCALPGIFVGNLSRFFGFFELILIQTDSGLWSLCGPNRRHHQSELNSPAFLQPSGGFQPPFLLGNR